MSDMIWTVHPAKNHPYRAILGICSILLFAFIAGDGFILGYLYIAILFLPMHQFYFPTTYKVDADGASYNCIFYKRKMTWKEVSWTSIGSRGSVLNNTSYKEIWLGRGVKPHFSMFYCLKGIPLLTYGLSANRRDELNKVLKNKIGKVV